MEKQAVQHYREALRLNPKLTEAYLNLGYMFLFHYQDTGQAATMYQQAIKLDPRNKVAHNNLGVIYLEQNKLPLAETQFGAAIELDKDYVDALYNMACLTARQGRASLAISYLIKASRKEPQVAAWAVDDEDLKGLTKMPEFQTLLKK